MSLLSVANMAQFSLLILMMLTSSKEYMDDANIIQRMMSSQLDGESRQGLYSSVSRDDEAHKRDSFFQKRIGWVAMVPFDRVSMAFGITGH